MMSELRQDLVSGDWILIAPGRARKPDEFKNKTKRKRQSKRTCLFEHPEQAGDGSLLLALPDEKKWKLKIIPNKYPAVSRQGVWAQSAGREGPFYVLPGYGYHELLITKSHDKNFAELPKEDTFLVLKALKERYGVLSRDNNIAYVSMFHNWGPTAGASVDHPHCQIIAIPVIPPGVWHSLEGAFRYKEANNACAHCVQIAWEREQKSRILFQNSDAIAFTPFASKEPFEMRIFLKHHSPFFEESNDREFQAIAEALRYSLRKLEKALGFPDYNFYIHTAPVKERNTYGHYHWHIEVVPRTNISAGFELGTDIEINQLNPDEAAEILKNA